MLKPLAALRHNFLLSYLTCTFFSRGVTYLREISHTKCCDFLLSYLMCILYFQICLREINLKTNAMTFIFIFCVYFYRKVNTCAICYLVCIIGMPVPMPGQRTVMCAGRRYRALHHMAFLVKVSSRKKCPQIG